MDGIPGALARKVCQEQIDEGQVAARIGIVAHQEIAWSQNLERVFIERNVRTSPCAKWGGKRGERQVWGNILAPPTRLEQNCRQPDEAGGQNKAPSAECSHHFFLPSGQIIRNAR